MTRPDAQTLARTLMDTHGLHAWGFDFDRARRRAGACHHGWTKGKITLSGAFTERNPEAVVRDVVLHEIAHALAGSKAGHGPEWRSAARRLGCSATRCYSREAVTPPPTFQGVCPACGHRIVRFRRKQCSCGRCSSKYTESLQLVWTRITDAVEAR